jgi:hypothetical protein
MKRPAMPRSSLPFLVKVVCASLSLASALVLAAPPQAQPPQRRTLESDRRNPRRAPEKTTTAKSPQTRAGGEQTSDFASAPQEPADGPTADAGPRPQGCDPETVLLRDHIQIIFVHVFNYPENSAIPVTVTQTNAGIMGFAMTDAGPFTPTLNIIINTDGNGNGVSAPVFTQGQNVGFTVVYGDTPFGSTTTLDYNVLPQCNCPPIPVVP